MRTATVWVETDSACEVSVLGKSARTFQVAGHHYALVVVEGLTPGGMFPYEVALDGSRRWPEPASELPPSVIRTLGGRPLELAFGSCRVAAPHEPPYTESHGIDALWALSHRMQQMPLERWPHVLVMVGDQVYADELSPQTRAFIRKRRSISRPPYSQVADYEEYTRLYWESWSDPPIRWLLANLPTSMIFDDHDIHDDWNTSAAWRDDMAQQPWWHERITSGLMSYWVYQHLGNLAPEALAANDLFRRVNAVEDAEPLLRAFAERAGATTDGTQWSYAWQLAGSRLVVVDSRAGRVLTNGDREMIDEAEWCFVESEMRAPAEHLVVATSLPFLLPRAIHDLEAWNEAICAGAWGPLGARVGELIRRALDLEHWAAFARSFRRLSQLIKSAATGSTPPRSIIVLSGDVHYAYLAEAKFPERGHAPVYQAVCSPLRNVLPEREKRAMRIAFGEPATRFTGALARRAGVTEPELQWQIDTGPSFANQLATLRLDGTDAVLQLERALLADSGPSLESIWQRRLTLESDDRKPGRPRVDVPQT
jgi:hypothetical protein